MRNDSLDKTGKKISEDIVNPQFLKTLSKLDPKLLIISANQ